MAPRPSLDRLKSRPRPDAWRDEEMITLAEAAAIFFPSGPMTANALRIAYRRGELAAVDVCGKIFTTPGEVKRLMTPRRSGIGSPADQ